MTLRSLCAIMGLAALMAPVRAHAYEVNAWPFVVQERDATGKLVSWTGLGPFLFSGPAPAPEAGTAEGVRPFYVRVTGEGVAKQDMLYPFFFYRKYPDANRWSFYEIINHEGIDEAVTRQGGPKDQHLDVWPFYFSHVTDSPVDTYHALLPVYGTVKYRLGFNRLHWLLFPLYVQLDRRGTRTTYVPFPFIRVAHGASNGFGVWPLFGSTRGPGEVRHAFWLWPFGWDNVAPPDAEDPPEAPGERQFGFLPFYMSQTSPKWTNVTYAWPFFGYTERVLPYRYSERRYFWPFLVQGSGPDRYTHRWGPFYTHSNVKGDDSRWVLWPFWHQKTREDGDTAEVKTQFFYWVYWSLDERSVSRPRAPAAYKRHVWPIVSLWDNGAGSRQVEFPSPLEVFFPDSADWRATWTPLFSLYRYDHRPSGEARTSVLWNALTWRRTDADGLVELHVGPLVGMRRGPAGRSWSILGFDFGAKPGEGTRSKR